MTTGAPPLTEAERARKFARTLRRWARTARKRHQHAKAAELIACAEKNEQYAQTIENTPPEAACAPSPTPRADSRGS